MTAFSANWKFGIVAKDLSNLLTTVDLNPIDSTVPSMTSSTKIQSPTWNLLSTKTKIPEIRFLKRSCAPRATATPNKPKPAIIGPIFIPQSSRTAATPNIKISTFIALIIQLTKSRDIKSPTDFITTESGPIIWWKVQKIKIVIRERLIVSIKFAAWVSIVK